MKRGSVFERNKRLAEEKTDQLFGDMIEQSKPKYESIYEQVVKSTQERLKEKRRP